MKIAFFGNTNNGPLMVSRALQAMGHDVLLIVNRKEQLHRPESRYPEYQEGYPEWIMDVSQFSEWDFIFLNPCVETVLDALSTHDVLILNSLGPSLLPLLHRPAISMLTGSDLYYYANYKTVEVISGQWSEKHKKTIEAKFWKRKFIDFVQRQRDGIRLSVAVHYLPSGIESLGDAILSEIGIQDSHRFFQFVADLDRITPSPQPNNARIRVFCPVRITWKLPAEPGQSTLDYKGSDIMIRGLSRFHRKTGTKLDIRLVRKGLHIDNLEQLIAEEGLDDQVTWLDEMLLTTVWEEMANSDIVLEQFGNSMIAMVGMDAMASSRPVIGNLRPEILGDSIPICQARTPEEICTQLERLVFDPQERERVGKVGREYVEKHASINGFARKCIKYLETALSNKNKPPFSQNNGLSYLIHQTLEREVELQKIASEHEAEMRKAASERTELLNHLESFVSSDTKAQKRIALRKPYCKEIGKAWIMPLVKLKHIADNEEHPHRSSLLLYEDDKLLQPSHALHEDIRQLGTGRYSHWNEALLFSTSDGSDPNTNGRKYRILYLK